MEWKRIWHQKLAYSVNQIIIHFSKFNFKTYKKKEMLELCE